MRHVSLPLLAASSLILATALASSASADGGSRPRAHAAQRARAPAPAARPAQPAETGTRAPSRPSDASPAAARPAVRDPAAVRAEVDGARREAKLARELRERRTVRELERSDAEEALELLGAEEIAAAREVYGRARAEALPIVARFERAATPDETQAELAQRKQAELEHLRPILHRAHVELDAIAQRVLAKLSPEQHAFLARRLAAKGIVADEGRMVARIHYLLTLVDSGPFAGAEARREGSARAAGPTMRGAPAPVPLAQRGRASSRPAPSAGMR